MEASTIITTDYLKDLIRILQLKNEKLEARISKLEGQVKCLPTFHDI